MMIFPRREYNPTVKYVAASHCVGVSHRRETCFLNSVSSNLHKQKHNIKHRENKSKKREVQFATSSRSKSDVREGSRDLSSVHLSLPVINGFSLPVLLSLAAVP